MVEQFFNLLTNMSRNLAAGCLLRKPSQSWGFTSKVKLEMNVSKKTENVYFEYRHGSKGSALLFLPPGKDEWSVLKEKH